MKKLKLLLFPSLLIIVGYVVFALFIHTPKVKPTYAPLSVTTKANLIWPNSSEAAVGIVGTNTLTVNGAQTPKPTASTAKLITALMVLKAKPLSLNEPGPTLTISPSDVAIYNKYVAENGSVAEVQSGEQISEYQMLEGMLLPSANNMADSLAIWAYGSLPAYSAAANSYLASLGLNGTHVGVDASGFDPSTTSTAEDLVKIGELVMQNPVLASIVGERITSLPIVGAVYNVNSLLGSDNIVGIKTGNTDQAGGVFVGAVKFNNDNVPTTVVTANVGTNTLEEALITSKPLLQSVQDNFHNTVLVSSGSVIASYKAPWSNQTVNAIASQTVIANVWGGSSFNLSKPNLPSITSKTKSGQIIASYSDSSLNSSTTKVSLSGSLSKPSVWWLLSHP